MSVYSSNLSNDVLKSYELLINLEYVFLNVGHSPLQILFKLLQLIVKK